MMVLLKLVVLRIAEAMVDWAGGPPGPDHGRISRVILAFGAPPIVVRGTQVDIDLAARTLAKQTKSSVTVLEALDVVHTDDRAGERN